MAKKQKQVCKQCKKVFRKKAKYYLCDECKEAQENK